MTLQDRSWRSYPLEKIINICQNSLELQKIAWPGVQIQYHKKYPYSFKSLSALAAPVQHGKLHFRESNASVQGISRFGAPGRAFGSHHSAREPKLEVLQQSTNQSIPRGVGTQPARILGSVAEEQLCL